MSDPAPLFEPTPQGPEATGPRRRPTVVTAAVAVMYVLAAVAILGLILVLTLDLGEIGERAREQALDRDPNRSQRELDEIESFERAGAVVGAVIGLLLAGAVAVLARFVNRGSRGARLTSWIVLGLYALCDICSLAVGGVGGSINLIFGVIEAPLAVAAIVLLALPAANAYFAKPAPA